MEITKLITESRNPNSMHIDRMPTIDLVKTINAEDAKIAKAVAKQSQQLAQAIDAASSRFNQGGRLIYCGAGTSGRLGVLDAVELLPTYGLDPKRAIALMAGGQSAMYRAVEGAEDSADLADKDLAALQLSEKDTIISLAASGRTPYAIAAVRFAKQAGALTVAVTCVADSQLSQYADITIAAVTGPEVVTGSTRMKAGTAEKMILNTLSTGIMIKAGKVYENLMIDLLATNAKLVERAINIIHITSGCDLTTAQNIFQQAKHQLPQAIIMAQTKSGYQTADKLLQAHAGNVTAAIADWQAENDAE
ncbi:MAG: N-acetylmuramic acid 6-phosphate etherase [Oenococcus sp.]|uniref:N-acetylmuramic acid 6-phosphate etherase n=1 Tax=Oenococcus kitaharae DSM 17330 TaxID=1045004 RepID=G9WES6_9LACO|nr:N-acetylmuramic acid 6-phosphate etherase [Oenococcus kitaharae]EHN58249.1 N-acetylmuramic acid 6-phosphate etherase [Oenococcus kitaharae DSM 17330]MCV3296509.1 N-acetylmuramic acid 6-phosphate etherase [Oenococcus kitaharae]OEY81570.1 N-acetylmuramic acid-6-phosphate etherase [Oenococcus kitaharae]OEY83056.1 N-acetylmuramic acid-6-phosphate etherase [Oenococcus kitaharae]OEY84398.1 N-acetylmuramic acid-6-phosphate etherase [Oenococcus kitaharae]